MLTDIAIATRRVGRAVTHADKLRGQAARLERDARTIIAAAPLCPWNRAQAADLKAQAATLRARAQRSIDRTATRAARALLED